MFLVTQQSGRREIFFELTAGILFFLLLFKVFLTLPNIYACATMLLVLLTYPFWRRKEGEPAHIKRLVLSGLIAFNIYRVYMSIGNEVVYLYNRTLEVDLYTSTTTSILSTFIIVGFFIDEVFNDRGRYQEYVYFNLDNKDMQDRAWIEDIRQRSSHERLCAYSKESSAVAQKKAKLLGVADVFSAFMSEEEADKEMLKKRESI